MHSSGFVKSAWSQSSCSKARAVVSCIAVLVTLRFTAVPDEQHNRDAECQSEADIAKFKCRLVDLFSLFPVAAQLITGLLLTCCLLARACLVWMNCDGLYTRHAAPNFDLQPAVSSPHKISELSKLRDCSKVGHSLGREGGGVDAHCFTGFCAKTGTAALCSSVICCDYPLMYLLLFAFLFGAQVPVGRQNSHPAFLPMWRCSVKISAWGVSTVSLPKCALGSEWQCKPH